MRANLSDQELDARINELFPDLPANPKAAAVADGQVAQVPCEGVQALQNAVEAPEPSNPVDPNPVDIVRRAMAKIESPALVTSTRRSRRAGQL